MIEKLAVGDYTLRETKAPTEDGYVRQKMLSSLSGKQAKYRKWK